MLCIEGNWPKRVFVRELGKEIWNSGRKKEKGEVEAGGEIRASSRDCVHESRALENRSLIFLFLPSHGCNMKLWRKTQKKSYLPCWYKITLLYTSYGEPRRDSRSPKKTYLPLTMKYWPRNCDRNPPPHWISQKKLTNLGSNSPLQREKKFFPQFPETALVNSCCLEKSIFKRSLK